MESGAGRVARAVRGRVCDWLRLFREDGSLVPTDDEVAEEERRRREAAERRIAELEAELQRLRGQ